MTLRDMLKAFQSEVHTEISTLEGYFDYWSYRGAPQLYRLLSRIVDEIDALHARMDAGAVAEPKPVDVVERQIVELLED